MKIDYHKPRRAGRKSIWLGVGLWIVIAVFLTAVAYGLCASKGNPGAWR